MTKKLLAIVLCCALMVSAGLAEGKDASFELWVTFSLQFAPGSIPVNGLQWNTQLVNRNFPKSVLRGVVSECKAYNGTPVNTLGLEPTGGSHMRQTPVLPNRANYMSNVKYTIHGNETVYLYFRFTDNYGREWYYAVTAGGIEGFLVSSRIMEIYD